RLGPAPRIAARGKTAQTSAETVIPADETVREESPYALGHADTLEASPEQARRLATASEMDRRVGVAPVEPRGRTPRGPSSADPSAGEPVGWGVLAAAVALGVAFVVVPVVAYAAGAPSFEQYLGACGTLPAPGNAASALVALGPQTRDVQVIEVLDPLCPACRGFERRFAGLDAASQVSRRALLFPLDDACNWMVDRAIHPGACAISEAVLCAEDDAEEVLAWAFENQEAIRTATEHDPAAAARMASERFPALRSCIGSTRVRARLNLALRWAVTNELPVLTPQVYVGDTRVCDADTDLGLDWTVARLLERGPAAEAGQRSAR
nr:thioredoxin domain-containing protein [Myxococcota bacterium]